MRGSVQIAKLFGIPVFVHWTFSLLFLFIIYMGISKDAGWEKIALLGFLTICLFTCVVLHEFGHALSARYYGVHTQDITILPIGGLARLDRLPEKPIQEFVVAIAGPAVNVVIYILLYLFLTLFYSLDIDFWGNTNDILPESKFETINFMLDLLRANLGLVLFNMIPAFPMDGGRVFRSLMSLRFGRIWATKVAAVLGQVIAVGFLIFAVVPLLKYVIPEHSEIGQKLEVVFWHFQPVLALISVFIAYSARNEYKSVRFDEILTRHTVANVLREHYTYIKTGDLIQTAAIQMKRGTESNFLVFDDYHILRGILLEDDIMDAIKNQQHDAIVLTYMTHEFRIVTPFESIKEVYYRMYQSGQYIMPVMNGEDLIGVVDMNTLQDFIEKEV